MTRKAHDNDQPESDGIGALSRDALDWPRATGRVCEFMAAIGVRRRRRRRRRLQAAAALVAVVGIAGIAWQTRIAPGLSTPDFAPAMAPFRPVLAVPDRRILNDGTVVEMKDDAVIAIAFTAGMRRVVLHRGEAHFKVTKDQRRPFVVVAGGIEVRAVGTAFAVEHREQAIEVFVTEGQVAVQESASDPEGSRESITTSSVTAADAPPGNIAPVGVDAKLIGPPMRTLAMLSAGKGAVVEIAVTPRATRTVSARVFEVSTSEMSQRMAWRAPRLNLSRTRLAQVILLINRHAATPLVLADAELGDLEMSGVLRADNVETLLHVLEQNYAIEAERLDDRIILRKGR